MFIEKISLDKLREFNKGGVFNSPEWLSLYTKDKLSVWGVFNKNNEIIGCFTTYKYKRMRLFGQLAAAPFTQNNGLFVEDNTSNPAQKNTFNKKVLELVRSFLDNQKLNIITFSFPTCYVDMQPFSWGGYKVIAKYTYLLDLKLSDEVLMGNMSSERRKNIRKALKDGIEVKRVENSEELNSLIKQTFKKQKANVDVSILDRILTQFSSSKKSYSFMAYSAKGVPLAANFCVFDNDKAYYLLGGYNSEEKHEGAGALAMWEAIKYAKEKGINTFDFEGSMISRVEKFFRGFGGEIRPYYTVNKAGFFIEMLLKIKERNRF